MKPTRLFFVHCLGDGSWLTTRKTEGGGHIFEHAPLDPMLVSGPVAESEWTGPYQLVPTPFTVENWPRFLIGNELEEAIDQAKKAVVGDSNDAEHDALMLLLIALDVEAPPECRCDDVSWHGEGHATSCPVTHWLEAQA